MKLIRKLTECLWSFQSDNEFKDGINYYINERKVTEEEYRSTFNKKCLFQKTDFFRGSGKVTSKGYYNTNSIITKQYLPLN